MQLTQDEFVSYLAGLAEPGETLLIIQQKPVFKQRQQQFHADGTPKYVWIPQLPDEVRRPGLAWYANTGSFIVDLMRKNYEEAVKVKLKKPHSNWLSASKDNCTHVLCMMLDDIGTKSKTPPLKPTWIIESSPNNYQYGYAFSDQPTKEEYVAAFTAIAAAGYSDPAASNAVRNFRIPGSVNIKEGRGEFVSRLVEFNPDREFALKEICDALDVEPGSPVTDFQAVHLKDTGADPVLKWLNEQGLVLGPINSAGWIPVVCPNHEQHTTGEVSAKYHPADHGFCCYHGHCESLGTKEFLAWVAEHGGPEASHGIRTDIIQAHMIEALNKAEKPAGLFGKDAEETKEEQKGFDDLADERAKWFTRYAYNKSDDAFFDTERHEHVSRKVFDALHRHHLCKSTHSNKKINASNWFDERREEMGGIAISKYIYAPGEGTLVNYEGAIYGNLWIDARPKITAAHAGPIDIWLDHAKLIVPNDRDREHLFNIMAFKLQNPGIKINHAVLHTGVVEGSGKDTFWAPFFWAVCGESRRNFALVDNEHIGGNFSYEVESEIIVLNELKEPNAGDRRALANKLKPFTAAPPEVLPVNKKNLHPYNAKNRVLAIAFSNEMIPLTLASTDRRWFCIETTTGRLDERKALRIWDWYTNGDGYQSVASWLYRRDVSAFNPKAYPEMTEYKLSIVEGGMSAAESYVLEEIRNRKGEFSTGVVGAPFHKLCDQLSVLLPTGARVVPAALFHALQEAGWKNIGESASSRYSSKKHLWCAPELASMSKSDLRNLFGDSQSDLKIHKLGNVGG